MLPFLPHQARTRGHGPRKAAGLASGGLHWPMKRCNEKAGPEGVGRGHRPRFSPPGQRCYPRGLGLRLEVTMRLPVRPLACAILLVAAAASAAAQMW